MFPKVKKLKKIIYLDHAAATPLDRGVKQAMEPFFSDKFGNPSALYKKGREAKQAVEDARNSIARIINASPSEIIFTAGGTESVNLAIFGIARNHAEKTAVAKSRRKAPHIITSAIEHHCVINSFKALAGEGYKASFIEVDTDGVINLDKLKKSIRPETVFISVMLANNEIGTIEPVAEIARWLKGENQNRQKKNLPRIIFHTDACQAAGFLDLDINKLGVDLLSVNGSKIYGPKQSGFLYIKSGIQLRPLLYGGGQEKNLRSGTENVAGAVGLAKALELVTKTGKKESLRLEGLTDYLSKQLFKKIPRILLNGPAKKELKVSAKVGNNKLNRLPNNLNLSIKGLDGEALMLYLDSYGICVSTSSACSTGNADPSHVLLALGRSEGESKSSIRFTLGKETKKADLDYLIKIFPSLVYELRRVKK